MQSKDREFVKPCENLSPEQVELLFNHSYLVWKALKDRCISPKPLRYELSSIVYEYCELPSSLEYLLRKADSAKLEPALIIAGEMLALIHEHKGLLHSDYVVHNLFYDDVNGLYIIDAHPPEVLDFQIDLINGDYRRDLYFFLMSIPGSYGFKKSLLNQGYILECQKMIVTGYSKLCPILNIDLLYSYKIACQIFKIRRRAGFGIINGLFHALFSLFFLIRLKKTLCL